MTQNINQLINKKIDKKLVDLVHHIAYSYRNDFVELEDLIQEGFFGLYKAYKNFDPSKNVLFSTYAFYWIKKQIKDYLKNITKFRCVSFDGLEIEKIKYEEKYDFEETNVLDNYKTLLSNLEKKVLELNLYKGQPLDKIAEILNLKREKVRQIYVKALRKIKINKRLTKDLYCFNNTNV